MKKFLLHKKIFALKGKFSCVFCHVTSLAGLTENSKQSRLFSTPLKPLNDVTTHNNVQT